MERSKLRRCSCGNCFQDPSFSSSRLLYRALSDSLEDESVDLAQEVGEVLSQIYREFYNDFSKRMDKRCQGDILGEVQQYNMLVQKGYLLNCQAKVEQIVQWNLSGILYKSLNSSARAFISQLHACVSEISDPNLRLVLLNDAFHVTINAAEEIGKIATCLFRRDRRACKKMNLRHFNDVMGSELRDTLSLVNDQSGLMQGQVTCGMEILKDLGRNLLETAGLNEADFTHADAETLSLSTEAETVEDALNDLRTLDELVDYIEPPKQSRKRRKRKPKSQVRTASSSNSPSRPHDEDLDVERLKLRLANQKPAENRVKPNLRADWLQSLCTN